MDTEKLFIKAVAALVAVVVISSSSCTMHANHQASRLLEAGIDGRHVKCAIYNGSSNSDIICGTIED